MHTPSVATGVFALLHAMQLPKLSPGKRFTLPRPAGSADACCWPAWASAKSRGPAHGHRHADAGDAQRLIDEMAFFAPGCAARCFPTGKPCPTTASRRTRT
jgi:transcription-repair coupling factor (superfamily II helicase)